MFLSYTGITSKHVIFAISFKGGQWEYTPSIILAGGFSIRPEAIQAPKWIPGGEVIGGYTIPSGGVILDYTEYEPFTNNPEDIPDLFDVGDWQQMIWKLLARNIWAYYLLPEEQPISQPTYYDEYNDAYGYQHLIPAKFGDTPSDSWYWAGANEYYEGMAIHLPFAGILCGCTNVLPSGWNDGRFLCLNGGGIYPLIPRFCIAPGCYYTALQNFCISSLGDWDGDFNHGYGNTTSERTQMTSLDEEVVQGFDIDNARNTVAAFPLYGPTVLCDEYVTVRIYEWSGWSPAPPRIVPIPPPEPDDPGAIIPFIPIAKRIFGLSSVSLGASRTLWEALNMNSEDVLFNDNDPTELKGK